MFVTTRPINMEEEKKKKLITSEVKFKNETILGGVGMMEFNKKFNFTEYNDEKKEINCTDCNEDGDSNYVENDNLILKNDCTIQTASATENVTETTNTTETATETTNATETVTETTSAIETVTTVSLKCKTFGCKNEICAKEDEIIGIGCSRNPKDNCYSYHSECVWLKFGNFVYCGWKQNDALDYCLRNTIDIPF
ncbi:hypothetical protein HDU92_006819 [Lobulomyces angularis]|nr:hypothetical protein HDU92_006819 [Lobulomyces angularis]